MSDLRNLAKRLGLETYEALSADLKYGIEKQLPSDSYVKFTNLMGHRDENSRLVVGEVSFRWESSPTSDSNRTKTIKQSFAYYERTGLGLPNITIQPRSVAATMMSTMTSMMGITNVHLTQHPAASQKFIARSMQPQSTGQLLSKDVLEALVTSGDYTLKTNKFRMLLYQRNVVMAGDQYDRFVDDAKVIFKAIVDQAEELPELTTQSEEEARSTIENLTGPIGAIYRSQIVSKNDLEELLGSQVPRTIPPQILKQRLGYESILFYIVSLLFIVFGAWLVHFLWNEPRVAKAAAMVPGLLIPMGLGGIYLTNWYRKSRIGALRNGVYCTAQIESVTSTNTKINNRRRYRLGLKVDHDQVSQTVLINIYEPAVERAFELMSNGQPTRVLVDPNRPERIFWVDSLTIVYSIPNVFHARDIRLDKSNRSHPRGRTSA